MHAVFFERRLGRRSARLAVLGLAQLSRRSNAQLALEAEHLEITDQHVGTD